MNRNLGHEITKNKLGSAIAEGVPYDAEFMLASSRKCPD